MKNIHIILTDKPSRLHFDGKLFLSTNPQISREINSIVEGRNIYITKNEEIKERDWFLNSNGIFKAKANFIHGNPSYKKIILTTDADLIKDGVQAIDDDFLELFIKNPSCEEVELANSLVRISSFDWRTNYKIIIPKEEIYFDFIGELDGLPNLSDVIKEKFSTKEEQCTCKEHDPYCCQIHGSCPTCVTKEEPKQETLLGKTISKKDADKDSFNYEQTKCYCGHTTYCDCSPEESKQEQTAVEWLIDHFIEYGFDLSHHKLEIEQAKEMEKQQQGYSEEEVIQFVDSVLFNKITRFLKNPKEVLQQFKNK